MSLYIIICMLFGLIITTVSSETNLKWPEEYTVKATKLTLTANIIEDYQIWMTKDKSRIDYNNGAVRKIVVVTKTRGNYTVATFNIHHEASSDQNSHIKCTTNFTVTNDEQETFKFDTFLPDANTFHSIGADPIFDFNNTVIFEYKYTQNRSNSEFNITSTMWAIENNVSADTYWIPIRYEYQEFNANKGSKHKHEIWEFEEFSSSVTSNSDVFDVDNYNCSITTHNNTINNNVDDKPLTPTNLINDKHVDHIFKAHIAVNNNMKLGFKVSTNKFAVRTSEVLNKFKDVVSHRRADFASFPYTETQLHEMAKDLPAEYDATMFGLVSTVKDEAECRSFWAFAAAGAAEGGYVRAKGILKSFSTQALIDCAWPFGTAGCQGGSVREAYKWMIAQGLPTEVKYGAYKNEEGLCRINEMKKKYKIREFINVPRLSDNSLKVVLVNHGPLAVQVHATESFRMYSTGIFYDINCNSTLANHELLLVGYGEKHGKSFWILKNSWGTDWGIDGFMHISTEGSACGVTAEPSYVVF